MKDDKTVVATLIKLFAFTRQQNTTCTFYLLKSVFLLWHRFIPIALSKTLPRLALFEEQELTHESTEGDDGQQTLDQNPEPVGQGSVVAAVRIRFDDLRHVGDFKDIPEQKPFPQEELAVQTHDDTQKTTTETKGGNHRNPL